MPPTRQKLISSMEVQSSMHWNIHKIFQHHWRLFGAKQAFKVNGHLIGLNFFGGFASNFLFRLVYSPPQLDSHIIAQVGYAETSTPGH